MKIYFLPVWLVVGVVLAISRLAAQDVIVTDPAWLDPESPPADVLPTFKKRPKSEVPEEIKKPEQVAYSLVWEVLDENGKRLRSERFCSNPYLDSVISSAVAMDAMKYVPAKRGGKNVMVSCWFAVIFNPRSAAPGKENATPRLLSVAPVDLSNDKFSDDVTSPLVIWATLKLDEMGRMQEFVFEKPACEALRPEVGNSLSRWRFAPALHEGHPVAGELKVPLILHRKFDPRLPGTPPKVLSRVQPIYPFAMKATQMRGEVLVEFVVDKTGAVKDVVVRKTNNPGFNEAAIRAIKQWKFEPGRVGGEPMSARMQQPFDFEYTGDDSSGRDYATVKPASKKAKAALPEELRYDIPPKAKSVVPTIYPYFLLNEGKSGTAKVAFLIDITGKVSEVRVLEASNPEFGLALTAAIEAHEFIPAMKDGRPTQSILNMEREFSLSEGLVTSRDKELLKTERKHPERILTPKKLDAAIRPASQQAPVFPSAVQGKLSQGKAMIEILIDEEGKVCLPRIVEASDPAFGYAAVQAIVAWVFEPPKAGGKPVVVRAKVPFYFGGKAP